MIVLSKTKRCSKSLSRTVTLPYNITYMDCYISCLINNNTIIYKLYDDVIHIIYISRGRQQVVADSVS